MGGWGIPLHKGSSQLDAQTNQLYQGLYLGRTDRAMNIIF